MRSPFTGIVFSLELTHDINMLLPLLIACMVAHGFTVLTLRRSILTEKISRRGYHLSREYAVDPLEILFVREVARTQVVALPEDTPISDLLRRIHGPERQRGQHLFPVVDQHGAMIGVVTRSDVEGLVRDSENGNGAHAASLASVVIRNPVIAYPDEPLRVVVYHMAATGLTRFPVVSRDDEHALVGMISLQDLLKGRAHNLEAERRRERILPLRLSFPRRAVSAPKATRSQ